MQKGNFQELITRQLNGSLLPEEQEALHAALASNADGVELKTAMEELLQQTPPDENYDEAYWAAVAQQIIAIDKPATVTDAIIKPVEKAPFHRIHFLKTTWFRYAAVVLLLLGGVAGFRTLYKKNKAAQITARIEKNRNNDSPPGGNKALLTLANGTTIVLDTAANGQLASQGNISIVKLQNGQLKFVVNPSANTTDTTTNQLNTITTPRGGQYQLQLPDGTHIWLNAETAFTFPTAFTSNMRLVKLNGEAYFEVKEDAAHPFRVALPNTWVDVLGTHFNVNAYPDEKTITTTLLKGKVQVQSGNSQATLLPGYQCRTTNGSNSINQHGNTEEAVAWKNGQFQFKGADVKSIMRQVSRWYNVDVNYIDEVPSAHITGEIPRTLTLRQMTSVLEESGISIWLENDNQLYIAQGQ